MGVRFRRDEDDDDHSDEDEKDGGRRIMSIRENSNGERDAGLTRRQPIKASANSCSSEAMRKMPEKWVLSSYTDWEYVAWLECAYFIGNQRKRAKGSCDEELKERWNDEDDDDEKGEGSSIHDEHHQC